MKTIVVLVLLCLAAGSLAAGMRRGKPSHSNGACTRAMFNEWKAQHNRVYSGAEEESSRYSIFCENVKKMRFHQLDNPEATFAMNKYADVSEHQFKRTHRNYKYDAAAMAKSCLYSGSFAKFSTAPIPTSFDWRSSNKVSVVKDQQDCGGCWAFSTIANMESYYAIKNNVAATTLFSEQMLIDCSHGCSVDDGETQCNQGCDGGFPWNAMQDILQWGGVVSESSYPYKDRTDTCKINFNSPPTFQARIANYTCLTTPTQIGNEANMAAWLVANGPFTIGINASPLQSYDGGILDPSHCSPDGIDHAVTIVGYGASSGKNFWIVKNSWGTDWGENGYFRIVRGKDSCGLAYAASSVNYH